MSTCGATSPVPQALQDYPVWLVRSSTRFDE
jgi:hypothetical protein